MDSARIQEFQEQFFSRVLAGTPRPMEPEPVSCATAEKALFDLAAALQQSAPVSDEAQAGPVGEQALLEAIASMAEHGAVEAFAGMMPRLRRAVRARLRTLLTVVVTNQAAKNDCISYLPRGFPAEHVGMALLVTLGVELPTDLREKLE